VEALSNNHILLLRSARPEEAIVITDANAEMQLMAAFGRDVVSCREASA